MNSICIVYNFRYLYDVFGSKFEKESVEEQLRTRLIYLWANNIVIFFKSS